MEFLGFRSKVGKEEEKQNKRRYLSIHKTFHQSIRGREKNECPSLLYNQRINHHARVALSLLLLLLFLPPHPVAKQQQQQSFLFSFIFLLSSGLRALPVFFSFSPTRHTNVCLARDRKEDEIMLYLIIRSYYIYKYNRVGR